MSSVETRDSGGELLADEEPDFPHKELARLDMMINRPRWVVPVLPKGELEVLIEASIKLCKKNQQVVFRSAEFQSCWAKAVALCPSDDRLDVLPPTSMATIITDLDTKSEACKRFLREGLTVSFIKLFTDEALINWKRELHQCIMRSAERLLELCVVKLSQDSLPLLNLLALVLNPNCKFHIFHETHSSETVPSGTQLTDDELFALPSDPRTPKGWLVDLVNKFGKLNGFQKLLDRFMNGTSLTVQAIAALIRPFGLCSEVLTTHVIEKYFMPLAQLVLKVLDGLTVAELKKLSETEPNYNEFSEIMEALRSLASRIPGQEETIEALEVFRLKLIHRIIICKCETVDLSHPWPAGDVVFLVEQKKIHANKGVLSLSSPVFEAMLFNEFKEKVYESIPLPEKKYIDILLLFTICHTLSHDVPSFLIADIDILLHLASEYQMNRVKKLCKDWCRMPIPGTPMEQLNAIKISKSVDLSRPWPASDVIFMVEQKEIYANKGVLSLSSPVYDAMLFSDFKEKMSESIPLPGKKYDHVLLLFTICHTLPHDVPNALTGDSVEIVLPLAREYQVQRVLKLCEEHLLSQTPSVLNLIIAREFGFKHLEEICMKYVSETPLDQLKLEEGFQELKVTVPCDK